MDGELYQNTLSVLTLAACLEAYKFLKRKKKTRPKRLWVRDVKDKDTKNVYENLIDETRLDGNQVFYDFHKMSRNVFQELLEMVLPLIQKQDTKLRKAIPAEHRLSVTIRFLTAGDSRRSLELQYGISHSLISTIIPEVCRAIYNALKGSYLTLPKTADEWQDVALAFDTWNFPQCIGALVGKRILMRKTPITGPESSNKSQHSIAMVALVDANYRFMYVDVGSQEFACDTGIWDKCTLRNNLEKNQLHIPSAASLPFTATQFPYVVIGDEAFPLKNYLMVPYSGESISLDEGIFNYRLARARRVSENAFGILTTKFQVFQQPINTRPEYVEHIIVAAVALYNFLMVKCGTPLQSELFEREDVKSGSILMGEWQETPSTGVESLEAVNRVYSNVAETVRGSFKDYFMNCGQVPWQERMALLQ